MARPVITVAALVPACLLFLAPGAGGPLGAAETAPLEQTTAPATCDTPQHHQLDFWVGDWQVFDAATNRLVALDQVRKRFAGCIVEENLTFLTDMYRRPGVQVRLAGIAVNRFDGTQWLQMWADNQWGAIFLRGTPGAEGDMVFVTVIPSRERDVKLVYRKGADGTVRILQYVAPAGSGKWQKYGDLINRPNR
ncbi:MAG: hypothetical protein JO361_10565 [Gammaproteobacteria bacterium]|nr:hypothetical protein [Gammaproteobacteria bacterium]